MSSLHGPYKGPTGDWFMWEDSGLENKLKAIIEPELLNEGVYGPSVSTTRRYYLYGDLAYWPGYGIMGPWRAG